MAVKTLEGPRVNWAATLAVLRDSSIAACHLRIYLQRELRRIRWERMQAVWTEHMRAYSVRAMLLLVYSCVKRVNRRGDRAEDDVSETLDAILHVGLGRSVAASLGFFLFARDKWIHTKCSRSNRAVPGLN